MPRPLLVILKACWAVLAWVLFLSGVIGCAQGDAGDANGTATNLGTSGDTAAPDGDRPELLPGVGP